MSTRFNAAECKRLASNGWSHRKLMAHYGVSLRKIQTTLNPIKRRIHDITQTFYGRKHKRLRRVLRMDLA